MKTIAAFGFLLLPHLTSYREMLKRPHEEDPSMLEMNVEGHQEDGPAIPRKTLLGSYLFDRK